MLKSKRQKKCKAKGCDNTFSPMNSMQKVCSPRCALQFNGEQKRKEFDAETRKRKQKLKSRQQWLKEAQAAFNSYIRVRDEGKPCISCQRYHSGKYDAGHYRTVGAAGHLRFNLKNCHRQCVPCNQYLSGNVVEYRINLVNHIGAIEVDKLESNNETRHFDIEYAKRIKRIFTKRSRLYKKLRGCD